MNNQITVLVILLSICSGCQQSSSPPNLLSSEIILRTAPNQYIYDSSGTQITILLQNNSPYPIYCSFVKNRIIFRKEELNETTWIKTYFVPIFYRSRDSIYNDVVPAYSTYQDTSTQYDGPGMYRLSLEFYCDSPSPGIYIIYGNNYQVDLEQSNARKELNTCQLPNQALKLTE